MILLNIPQRKPQIEHHMFFIISETIAGRRKQKSEYSMSC